MSSNRITTRNIYARGVVPNYPQHVLPASTDSSRGLILRPVIRFSSSARAGAGSAYGDREQIVTPSGNIWYVYDLINKPDRMFKDKSGRSYYVLTQANEDDIVPRDLALPNGSILPAGRKKTFLLFVPNNGYVFIPREEGSIDRARMNILGSPEPDLLLADAAREGIYGRSLHSLANTLSPRHRIENVRSSSRSHSYGLPPSMSRMSSAGHTPPAPAYSSPFSLVNSPPVSSPLARSLISPPARSSPLARSLVSPPSTSRRNLFSPGPSRHRRQRRRSTIKRK
jgi:hypothetical protein